VAGGIVLAWPSQIAPKTQWIGAAAVAGACFFWALDNNLTRRVASADALFVAGIKGLAAGAVNTGLALAFGAATPAPGVAAAALLVGFTGYGVSLVLFVIALRGLGAARTGAYFATAPFIGLAASIAVLGEPMPATLWLAGALMALGVWLHLSERHEHEHTHLSMEHTHRHRHDAHHRHAHEFAWDGREPHSHPHRHEPITHRHPHYPDAHHRHPH
jgi:drug/metabolite transporter (DMT)-like permease